MTPVRAFLAGAAAGALGSLAQDAFFALTSRMQPKKRVAAFEPPEPEQRSETPAQTIARRAVEGMLGREFLEDEWRAGRIVHYAYGSAWGAAYGLAAESYAPVRTAAGGLAFGAALWMASDNLILPFFRLSAWPNRRSLAEHAYALAAHLVYGAAVWGAFEAARRRPWWKALPILGAAWSTRHVPAVVRGPARKTVTAIREMETLARDRAHLSHSHA
ncbi:MAG TPA: DUF1440 domain-containing protein [Polyangiaceae bacterium]